MKIWISTYQLVPKQIGTQKARIKFRKGSLLRIRFDDGLVGFADLCPFPEMGDRPIEMELKQLVMNKPTFLGERSLAFARMDAEARSQNIQLFDPKAKIKNHFLVTEIKNFELSRVKQLEASGYSEFKIKMGSDLGRETVLLGKFCEELSSASKVRLDFNACLNRDRFSDWIDKNQMWLRPHLEYIEDPFTYSAQDWREVGKKWNIPFALDLANDPLECHGEGASVIVIKPALQNADLIVKTLKDKNKKFVFTHYMDFPVGQMFALVTAQKYIEDLKEQLLTCGLQQQDLYDELTFQKQIKADGPFVLPPVGYGIGFDKILNEQKWIELN